MVARKYLVKRVLAWQVVDTPNIFTNNARHVSLLDFFSQEYVSYGTYEGLQLQ